MKRRRYMEEGAKIARDITTARGMEPAVKREAEEDWGKHKVR